MVVFVSLVPVISCGLRLNPDNRGERESLSTSLAMVTSDWCKYYILAFENVTLKRSIDSYQQSLHVRWC